MPRGKVSLLRFDDRIRRPDRQLAVLRHGLLGVDDDIGEGLVKLFGIAHDRMQVFAHFDTAPYGGAVKGEFHRLGEDRCKIRRLEHRAAALGEGQELASEFRCPLQAVLGLPQKVLDTLDPLEGQGVLRFAENHL